MMRQGACVAFGSFEFVHRGHLEVADRVVKLAKRNSLRSIIVSFPKEGEVYTTEREKEYLLQKSGIEQLITRDQEERLSEFLCYLIEELKVKIIVVGENYADRRELEELAKELNIQIDIVQTICYKERPITQEWLEFVFELNDFELLSELCGHPYILLGDVVHGKKLGRTVGMPTINLHIYKTKKRPNSGVYATMVTVGEEKYKSATNIGRRPTVDDFDYITIETFILDFNKQIYGEICLLEIHKFLREVRKFESLEEVQAQVDKDIEEVYALFVQK